MTNISSGTIIRTILLILALINQVLSAMGKSPLPIENSELEQIITWVLTSSAAIFAWWKNNSFTKSAIAADEALASIKAGENENMG